MGGCWHDCVHMYACLHVCMCVSVCVCELESELILLLLKLVGCM